MRVTVRWALAGAALALAAVATAQSRGVLLSEAVAAGKVRCAVHGLGGSSGDTVRVYVQKTPKAGPAPLVLEIPPGTLLQSDNRTTQAMVVAGVKGRMAGETTYSRASRIELADNAISAYLVEAYCAEFEKANPTRSTRFRMARPDPTLACVLREAASRRLSVRATQAAVWILTDRVSYGKVRGKFPVSVDEWNAAVEVAKACWRSTR